MFSIFPHVAHQFFMVLFEITEAKNIGHKGSIFRLESTDLGLQIRMLNGQLRIFVAGHE